MNDQAAPTEDHGGSEGQPTPDVDQEKAQVDQEMAAESGQLQSEIERRGATEHVLVPGSRQLDREWKRHEGSIDAEVPADEARLAARSAGDVASLVDEDRVAVEHEAGAGTTGTRDEVEKLAEDAVAAGLKATQDSLDAWSAPRCTRPHRGACRGRPGPAGSGAGVEGSGQGGRTEQRGGIL